MPGFDRIPETIVTLAVMRGQTRWSPKCPATRGEALLDYAMLSERRMLGPMGISTLAKRWGRSRGFVRNVVSEYAKQCQVCGIVGKDTLVNESGTHTKTPKPVKKQVVGSGKSHQNDTKMTGKRQSEASHARGLLSDPDTETDPPTPGGSRPRPSFMTTTPASAAALAELWQAELDASPAGLRGKPAGLLATWPTDLLMAGEVDAAKAVRAIAELCRGTPTRKPRTLKWELFFGPKGRYRGAWLDALAWKTTGASEPAIGRDYIMQGKSAGVKSPTVESVDGWGDVS